MSFRLREETYYKISTSRILIAPIQKPSSRRVIAARTPYKPTAAAAKSTTAISVVIKHCRVSIAASGGVRRTCGWIAGLV